MDYMIAMKVLALVVLIIIIVVILFLQQTDGFEAGPAGAFNIVKGVHVTAGGTGYHIMPTFTPKATGLTFSTWFVLTGNALPGQWSRLFDMATTTPSPPTATVLTFDSDGKLHCYHSVAGIAIDVVSRTKLALHTMYHVAWTIDVSGKHTLYLNGIEEGTGTKALSMEAFPHFFLGKSNWAGTEKLYPNMTIYDFRMFDRALTAAEVTSSVATTRPSPASMVGPAGPAGAQGPAGPAGPAGTAGTAGAQGTAGPAGTAGTAASAGTVPVDNQNILSDLKSIVRNDTLAARQTTLLTPEEGCSSPSMTQGQSYHQSCRKASCHPESCS